MKKNGPYRKRKPAQGGLHGVLDYSQTAGNPKKGDPIALLEADPFIRPYPDYSKKTCFFQCKGLVSNNDLIKGERP